MKRLKRYDFYTGLLDPGNVKDGTSTEPADHYSALFQGYPRTSYTKAAGTDFSVPPFEDKSGCGEVFSYVIKKAPGTQRVLLLDSVAKHEDDSYFQIRYTYNQLLQLSDANHSQYNYSGPKELNFENVITEHTSYSWEDPAGLDPESLANAPGLVSEKKSVMYQAQEPAITQNLFRKLLVLGERNGETGVKRYYYTGEKKGDGLDYEKLKVEEQITYSSRMDGRIARREETRPNDTTPGHTIKYQYCANTSEITAGFDGMVLTSDQKETAHYLHFENYLDEAVSIANSTMSSRFFTMDNVELADDGFLAERCLRATGSSDLSITAEFGVRSDPGRYYIFSCYRKENADSPWRYFQKACLSATLAAGKKVHTFKKGQLLCHIMVREEECLGSVRVYHPDTMLPIGSIDNYGVPTFLWYDKIGRPLVEFQGQLAKSADHEACYDLTGKAAISPITINGYSRFNGFNCHRGPAPDKTPLNSTIQFSFPDEGTILPPSGAKLSGLQTVTLFAAGRWMNSEQTITVKAGMFTLKLVMSGSKAKLYSDNVVVQTSDAYLADQSLWALILIGNFVGLVVNGKVILSYVHRLQSYIKEVSTGSGTAANHNSSLSEAIIVAPKVLSGMTYFDYLGNAIQTQMLRYGRLVLTQKFYDRKGNSVLETVPAIYPLENEELATKDHVLAYRPDFAKMDFSVGDHRGMTGEIMDFYNSTEGSSYCESPDDKKWPFVMSTYEENAVNRLVNTRQLGSFGSKQRESKVFHDTETYKMFNDFLMNDSINFSVYKKSYEGSQSKYSMDTYSLFDSNRQVFVTRSTGKASDASDTVTFLFESGLKKNGNHTIFHTENAYGYGESKFPNINESLWAAGRKHSIQSPNNKERNTYYDSIGNVRLFHDTGKDSWQYMRYDSHSRITEAGLLHPTDSTRLDAEFEEKVNDPLFPTVADGTITATYRFYYDKNGDKVDDHLHDGFCPGRLTRTEHIEEGLIQKYAYDYLGRTIEYTLCSKAAEDQKLTYSLNCLGNPLTITYPENYTVTYEYNHYGQPSGIVIRKPDQASETVMESTAYNVFDQLCDYSRGSLRIFREWSLYSHLRYAGPTHKAGLPMKEYLNHYDQDALDRIYYNNDKGGVDSMDLSYSPLGDIADAALSVGGVTNKKSHTFDSHGNLSLYTDHQEMLLFTNHGDQMVNVKDSAQKTVAELTYDLSGNITHITSERLGDYFLAADDFYPQKTKSILKGGDISILAYDSMGRLIAKNNFQGGRQFYGYGMADQLAFQSTDDNINGKKVIYIYLGDLLVAQYDIKNNKITDLVYDDSNTLLYAHNGQEYKVNFLKMVFGEPTFPKNLGLTFLYDGMHYLEDLDVYEEDGRLYFYQFGITSSPMLDHAHKMFTPYRKAGNRPLR